MNFLTPPALFIRLLEFLIGLFRRPPVLLPAPTIPPFRLTNRGSSMDLHFTAPLGTLPDPTYQFQMTVSPQGGTAPVIQALASAATPSFLNLPDSPGTIALDILDAKGDIISGVTTQAYVFLAAPVIPPFTTTASATPPPVPGP